MNRPRRRTDLQQLRFNRFELTVLFVPLARAVFAPFGFVPAQFDESNVAPIVRVLAVILLGVGALVAVVGVLRQWPIIERAGLQLVAPLAVAYAIVLLAADWHGAFVSALIYLVIALVCGDRSGEITRTMRLANRWLQDREDQRR